MAKLPALFGKMLITSFIVSVVALGLAWLFDQLGSSNVLFGSIGFYGFIIAISLLPVHLIVTLISRVTNEK